MVPRYFRPCSKTVVLVRGEPHTVQIVVVLSSPATDPVGILESAQPSSAREERNYFFLMRTCEIEMSQYVVL